MNGEARSFACSMSWLNSSRTYFFNDTETNEVRNLPFVLVCQDCCTEVSRSMWLKLQNFTFSHFWRREVYDQGVSSCFLLREITCSTSCPLTCRQPSSLCFFMSSSFGLQQDPHFLFL